MMTALFPNSPYVTIRQGHSGDCYLLSALHLILNKLPGGLEKIKAMFTETPAGDVILKIKANKLSTNLIPDSIQMKYDYHFDDRTEEDVFIIDQAKLKEIDRGNSVETDSLAVKIFERISSYYFFKKSRLEDSYYFLSDQDFAVDASFFAHNERQTANLQSAEFVGLLLGFDVLELNIDQVIKLMKFDRAHQAIYVSMNYGSLANLGDLHSRHALAVDAYTDYAKNGKMLGGEAFDLINPWNNQDKETLLVSDLKTKKPKFFLFSMNAHQSKLVRSLLGSAEDLAGCVFQDRAFFEMLLQKKSAGRMGLMDDKDWLNIEVLMYKNHQKHFDRASKIFPGISAPETMTAMLWVAYYFTGDETYLVSQSLKYIAKHYSHETIRSFFGQDVFVNLVFMMIFQWEGQILKSLPALKQYIAALNTSDMANLSIETLMTMKPDAADFYSSVQMIDAMNPNLSAALLHAADAFFEPVFKMTPLQCLNELASQMPSDLKSWFLCRQSEDLKLRLIADAQIKLAFVPDISLQFDQAKTVMEIESQTLDVLKQVEERYKKPELQSAFDTLRLLRGDLPADLLLENKIQEILNVSHDHGERLKIQAQYCLEDLHFASILLMMGFLKVSRYDQRIRDTANEIYSAFSQVQADFLEAKLSLITFKSQCAEKYQSFEAEIQDPAWSEIRKALNRIWASEEHLNVSSSLVHLGLYSSSVSSDICHEAEPQKACVVS